MTSAKVKDRGPTVAELVLAFRQAKRAIASERGAVGIFELAAFEMQLTTRIRHLQKALRPDRWFDNVQIGRLVVMPKSATAASSEKSEIVRIGDNAPTKMRVDVRLQLEPTPEFGIVEVLYLWEFGGALEAMLSSSSVGYRLKRVRSEGAMDRLGRDVYDHWPTAFKSYRDDPIGAARKALRAGRHVMITSTDVVSFFDSINPGFLLEPSFVDSAAEASKRAGRPLSRLRYLTATRSLLEKYREFRLQRRKVGGPAIDVDVEVPIGSLVSRVFANVALASLDSHIEHLPNVVMYRRYVDDIVVVSTRTPGSPGLVTKSQVLGSFFPGFSSPPGCKDRFIVPATGAPFELREDKTRVHDLSGPAGIDFLSAVQSSFSAVTSERRAFLGNVDRLTSDIESIDLFSDGAAGADRVPRLRDADRFTLRRFMATAFIAGLERCALLLSPQDASTFLAERTGRMLSIIDGSFTFEDFEIVLSLAKVALLCNCREVIQQLAGWLARRTSEEMGQHVDSLWWRGQILPRSSFLRALLAFLSRRVREGVASACGFSGPPFPELGRDRAAMRNALLLRRTDLRYLDREDDAAAFGTPARERSKRLSMELESAGRFLQADNATRVLVKRVTVFLTISQELGDDVWSGVSAVGLLLSVNPPRYVDVARRFLARAETASPSPEVGRLIDECVDALRGTRYCRRRPALRIEARPGALHLHVDRAFDPTSVRVVLASLPVGAAAFEGAAQGKPELSLERLRSLDLVLRGAQRAARGARRERRPLVLVLPELSIPVRWTRDLASFAVKDDLCLIAGVEYMATRRGLANQAMGVFPAGHHSAAIVRWTKRNPAHREAKELGKLKRKFMTLGHSVPRLIVESAHGRLGVLICSEILEAASLSTMSGQVELLLVPAWNDDTWSFDHIAHAAASHLLHSFMCVANNAEASDSRIVAPLKEPRWARDWCRLIHRGEAQVIWGDLPVAELREIHEQGELLFQKSSGRAYRPLPPGWQRSRKGHVDEPF